MADQVEVEPSADISKPWPRIALIACWVLTALLAGAFCLALANGSLGGLITTILLLLVAGSVATFLSLAELSVRGEQQFRERSGLHPGGE